MKVIPCILGLFSCILAGCSSITGLVDASDQFGCPIEGGVRCTSLSQTHERLHAGAGEVPRVQEAFLSDTLKKGARQMPQGTIDPAPIAPLPQGNEAEAIKGAGAPARELLYPENQGKGHDLKEEKASRLSEKVMVLWVLPWVDEDGDLVSDSRLWVRVRDARWGLESLRDAAMRRFKAADAL